MTDSKQDAAKKQEHSHFGGPWGALLLMVLMPLISLYLWMCIHRNGGALLFPRSAEDLQKFLQMVPMPTLRALFFFTCWLLLQILLQLFAPGKVVEGITLRDGTRLKYRINGWFSLWFSLAVVVALVATGLLPADAILKESGALLDIAILFSVLLSVFLHVHGLRSPQEERRSGNPIYDFFMGTALNPRIGSFDLKMFFESRIGMGTWPILNFAMAAAQYQQHGALSKPMILVCAFQLLYIADFFYFEAALLTTWDIMYENYGYMLAYAFLVWIPFNFSLQAQYLVYHQHDLAAWVIVAITLLNIAGYYIFRSANLQKHNFRTNASSSIWGKPARFIRTARGTMLLTSGWWGLSRHANYLGDLMMALAWCLPCGVSHLVPFFYFIYFAPLLINRERRDHAVCHAKYGADWEEYCRKVPWRIVPGVY